MLPENFPESNFTFTAPPSMPDCLDLRVFRNDEQIISCWQMTPAERMRAFIEGKIWLGIIGQGMPPVWLSAERPFHSETEPAEKVDKQRFQRLIDSKIGGFLLKTDFDLTTNLPDSLGMVLREFVEFLLTEE